MKSATFKVFSCPLGFHIKQGAVCLSEIAASQFEIRDNSPFTLICGINSIPVQLKTVSSNKLPEDEMFLTSDIFKEILIPEGIEIEVLFTGKTIKLGPIIGILTENNYLKNYIARKKVVEEYSLYAEMAERVKALIYVFSLKNFNSESKCVEGFIPSRIKNKWKWSRFTLPIPDLICNRMAFAASSPAYQKIKQIKRIAPNIKIINEITKVSKWKIARLLLNDNNTKKYIPETHLFREAKDVALMLQKYSSVFLKPVRRSLGLGIIKLEKNVSDNYTAYYNIDGSNYKIKGTVDSILDSLKNFMGNRSYIVQEGISVALYDTRPFDLRVTMQKDGSGKWSFTRCSARVAGPGNIVSNVAAGGRGYPGNKVLDATFGDMADLVMEKIVKAGFEVSKALDERIENIGDLGLDIGVDLDGRIYLFEVNFRAIKPNDIALKDSKAWFETYYKPIYYLRYLYDKEMEEKLNPQH